jgi:hypothetical protein
MRTPRTADEALMRRAFAAIAVVAVAACGGPSSPSQLAPLVVDERDAAAISATAPASTGGKPLPDAPTPEVGALQRCAAGGIADPELRDALATAIKLGGAGPVADRALVDALWGCFVRFRPSQAGASIMVVRDLFSAVLAVKDASYGPKAMEKISAPVHDPKDLSESLDEIQFWQATSIRLLGELRYAPAAGPGQVLSTTRRTSPSDAARKVSKDAKRCSSRSQAPIELAQLAGTASNARTSASRRARDDRPAGGT